MEFRSQSPDIAELHGVLRTLLIPLAARAKAATVFPALDPQDQFAQAALLASGTEVDTTPVDAAIMVNVLWRTRLIKQLGQAFFDRHPDSPGMDLGAGLAHHFQWLDNGCNSWLDVDLPEVIALREALLPCTGPAANTNRPTSQHTTGGKVWQCPIAIPSTPRWWSAKAC